MNAVSSHKTDTSAFTAWLYPLRLVPPSLQNNTADSDRLLQALAQKLNTPRPGLDFKLLQALPEILHVADYAVQCLVLPQENPPRLLDVQPLDRPFQPLGLAVDLGSSRVVIRLLELVSGQMLAEHAFDNPQIEVGPDILTRLHVAGTPDGAAHLQALIVAALNDNIQTLTRRCQLDAEAIYVVSLAGNSAMSHLLLGLPTRWMIREPYIPAANTLPLLSAKTIGLQVHERACLRVFPNIAAYFGGDLIAGILYARLHQQSDISLLVDVGTNAEVVLGNRDWLMACAGAAGPALESGVSRMGMMAGPGVIDRLEITPDTLAFTFHTIGDQPPVGICGSGLIDLAAQLFTAGLLDRRGKLVPERCGTRLTERNGEPFLVVVPADQSASGQDLGVQQSDLDSLLRAKAAMFTILETLVGSVGLTFDDIATFYVAGTFGAFINPQSAITIGMLPDLPRDRFHTLGNSSLEGATQVLTDPDRVPEIDTISRRITYLELNVNQDFMNRFSAARFLPHTDWGRFPSVNVPNRG